MFIGIDIGGTKCAVTMGEFQNGKFAILKKKRWDTSAFTPQSAMEAFADAAAEFADGAAPEAIGISCGGPLSSSEGVILSPPNLPGWDEVRIVDYLKERFPVPVGLQNDANACALAEWKFGAARGCRNVIFLTFGTGLGAGLILDGRLYSGTNDMAGEVGHIRVSEYGPVGYGKSGSLEGFCSGNGIAQIGRTVALEYIQQGRSAGFCGSMEEMDGITAKRIAEYAERGDEAARKVYRISAHKLGQGLSVLIDILNPEVIVIGSVFTRSQHLMREETEKVIREETLSRASRVCKLSGAELGEELGDYAALAVAVNTLAEAKA